jgi:hypothetical protein
MTKPPTSIPTVQPIVEPVTEPPGQPDRLRRGWRRRWLDPAARGSRPGAEVAALQQGECGHEARPAAPMPRNTTPGTVRPEGFGLACPPDRRDPAQPARDPRAGVGDGAQQEQHAEGTHRQPAAASGEASCGDGCEADERQSRCRPASCAERELATSMPIAAYLRPVSSTWPGPRGGHATAAVSGAAPDHAPPRRARSGRPPPRSECGDARRHTRRSRGALPRTSSS